MWWNKTKKKKSAAVFYLQPAQRQKHNKRGKSSFSRASSESAHFVSDRVFPFWYQGGKIGFKAGGSLINCLNAVSLLCNNTNNYCRGSCHRILVRYTCQKHTQGLIVRNIFHSKSTYSPFQLLSPTPWENSEHFSFSECLTKRGFFLMFFGVKYS